MGHHQLIGGSFADPFSCDGFTLKLISRSCKRRFQVKLTEQVLSSTKTATFANNERDLIQNIYLRQAVRNCISSAAKGRLTSFHLL
jgi:hypothetical protein